MVPGGRDGKMEGDGGAGGGVINTDRGESVLVWDITTGADWHDHTGTVVGSGQAEWAERQRVENE